MLVFVLSVCVRLYLNTSVCSVRKHRFEFHSRVQLLSAALHLFNPSLQQCYSTSTVDLHACSILSSRDTVSASIPLTHSSIHSPGYSTFIFFSTHPQSFPHLSLALFPLIDKIHAVCFIKYQQHNPF